MATLNRFLTILIVFTTAASISVGQEASPVDVHDELRQLRDGLLEAIHQKNAEELVGLVHEEIVMTAQDGTELNTIRKKEGVRDYIQRLFTGENAGVRELILNVEVDELTILHGDDAGVAFGHSRDKYVLRDGTQFELPTRWTATVVHTDDGWKLASLHVSSNLFKNPVLATHQNWIMLMGIVLGTFVVLAAILGYRLGRRHKRTETGN